MNYCIFDRDEQCLHDCPDCGEYLVKNYYLVRCSRCDIKREAKLFWGEITPQNKYCENCGASEYYIEKIETLCKNIQTASVCGLGQTAPNPVLSTLKYFRKEYEEHIYEKKCSAGECKSLMQLHIEADLCKGCPVRVQTAVGTDACRGFFCAVFPSYHSGGNLYGDLQDRGRNPVQCTVPWLSPGRGGSVFILFAFL